MATKRPAKNTDVVKVKREQSNVRLYWDQCDLLNELADAARCSVADAVERHLDGPLRDIIRKLYAEKLRSIDSAKSSRSKTE